MNAVDEYMVVVLKALIKGIEGGTITGIKLEWANDSKEGGVSVSASPNPKPNTAESSTRSSKQPKTLFVRGKER